MFDRLPLLLLSSLKSVIELGMELSHSLSPLDDTTAMRAVFFCFTMSASFVFQKKGYSYDFWSGRRQSAGVLSDFSALQSDKASPSLLLVETSPASYRS